MTVFRRNPAMIAARAAADLAAIKVQGLIQINAKAGQTRQLYITTSPGQDMIYIAKEREALDFLAAPVDDLKTYPLLAAEVGLTAQTAWELAQVWANVSVYWRGIAAQIEGARIRAIARIKAASDVDEIAAELAAFRPLS